MTGTLKAEVVHLDLSDPEQIKQLELIFEQSNEDTDEDFCGLMDDLEKIKNSPEFDQSNTHHALTYLGMYNGKALCKHLAMELVNPTIELLMEKYEAPELLGLTPYAVMEQMTKALEFRMGSTLNQMNSSEFKDKIKDFENKVEEVTNKAKEEHEDAQ